MNSIYPLNITLEGKPLAITGTDGASYVAEDGRTWLIPESGEGTDAETIQAHIQAELAKPGEEAMPGSISARQFFGALLVLHGIREEDIQELLSVIEDDEQRSHAMLELRHATEFSRRHPLIDQMAGRAGLTPEDVDEIFRRAPELFPLIQ